MSSLHTVVSLLHTVVSSLHTVVSSLHTVVSSLHVYLCHHYIIMDHIVDAELYCNLKNEVQVLKTYENHPCHHNCHTVGTAAHTKLARTPSHTTVYTTQQLHYTDSFITHYSIYHSTASLHQQLHHTIVYTTQQLCSKRHSLDSKNLTN